MAAGLLLFARTVDRGLNHDEHQFIAPGVLLSREGLLPYRDFPLFHLPNLVFAYAAVDRLTGQPILGPKLLCFACTWLGLGVILLVSLRTARGGTLAHALAAAAIGLLLVFDPLVIYTGGKTWNHEIPAFFLVLAVALHIAALRRDSLRCIALSGVACGLAVGSRLTVLPCLLPLLALAFFFPVKRERRFALAGCFAGGATVALLPSLYFLVTTPGPFLFDNLDFPRLRLLDPENTRIQKTMSAWRKVRFFLKEIVLPGWPLFAAIAALSIPGVRRFLSAAEPSRTGLATVLWTSLFLVIGCSLPSRYQYQHFFALVPLLALGLALSGPENVRSASRALLMPVVLAVLGALAFGFAVKRPVRGNEPFPKWEDVRHPQEWFSSEAVRVGAEIRQLAPSGRVLTLGPAWPMAGGVSIYPEFATGPFAWRSARFVPSDRREKFGFVGPDDLPRLLERQPPAGILTGVGDDDLEEPLIAYARSRAYTPHPLSRKRTFWRPPVR